MSFPSKFKLQICANLHMETLLSINYHATQSNIFNLILKLRVYYVSKSSDLSHFSPTHPWPNKNFLLWYYGTAFTLIKHCASFMFNLLSNLINDTQCKLYQQFCFHGCIKGRTYSASVIPLNSPVCLSTVVLNRACPEECPILLNI